MQGRRLHALALGLGLFLAVLASSAMAEVAPAYDLEDVLGSAFPSGMVAAPQGAAFAWVFNRRGVRNVWYAEAPHYRSRALTSFTEDDGQEIGSLVFSPDGATVVFVRGGPPNSSGELPNPRTVAAGVGTHLWTIAVGGGEAVDFGEGSAPFFLDGETLAFYLRGELTMSELAEYQPKQLVHARGSEGSPRLSPDGGALAFVSDRGSHSFVGVYDLESEEIRFLSPGVDRDRSPVWSPDGRQVAFVRVPAASQARIFEPQRETDEPWSILVADVATGEARQVFRAAKGPGSAFRGVESSDQLVWTRGGHIVFPWERSGYLHLWSIPAGGGEARELTPGRFEVEFVAALQDGRGVVFSSNQDDVDRRHLWRVDAQMSAPTALTSGSGIEQTPVPSGDGSAVGFLRASGAQPLHPAVRLADGTVKPLANRLLKDFPTSSMVEPQQVIFRAADGLEIHGQLFEPPATFSGRRPALLFLHGGSRRHMMLGWHYSSYYHHCYAFNQYMASRGYVVLSVNYRSGIGYGLEFREALDFGAAGASELNDVLGAGLYLQSRADVDPERVGLWGGSYGGYLTALGLARASDLFAAGVDIHGVHDWRKTIKNFVPSYEPLEEPEAAKLAFESSPMADVERWTSPVLLIHGDDDRNVPFSETIDLVDRLRELGVEHELMVFPDEVHGFLLHERWLQVFRGAARFFDAHLGDRGSDRASGG